MKRLCLYYRPEPERDRWLPGDRLVRPAVRRMIRGKPRPSGIDKVFINLCLGLDRLGIHYETNLPFGQLEKDDRVGVLGRGRHCLEGYNRPNPIVAGIGLMTHPSEWPDLCDKYPVACYLQHSKWTNDIYIPYFGEKCCIWPVGIDTEEWAPAAGITAVFDFLIYDKIMWDRTHTSKALLEPILSELTARGLTYQVLRYGGYDPRLFKKALRDCRAMIFLCEHESQGIAYLEGLSCGVPILAWNQGRWLDPNRFRWGHADVPATSIPYFDERCGVSFKGAADFSESLTKFLENLHSGVFNPREYVLERLTLEACAKDYLRHFEGP